MRVVDNGIDNWLVPTYFPVMDSCGSSFLHDASSSPESRLIDGTLQAHP